MAAGYLSCHLRMRRPAASGRVLHCSLQLLLHLHCLLQRLVPRPATCMHRGVLL